MERSLNKHLEQISRLIEGLRKEDIDLEKLIELDKSLDLLSHKIKTARLDVYSGELESGEAAVRQDAAFYFNREYKVIRFIGAFENIFGRFHPDHLPPMSSFLRVDDFKQLKERTEILRETGESQIFDTNILSKNGILLPVNVFLEKVRMGDGREAFSAGLVFYSETPSDLEDYRDILIENLPGMDVFLFDPNFRHVLAGGREKERLGFSNNDFTGKTLFEVFDEKTQKRLFPFYSNALEGKVSEGEVRIKNNVYFISATPVYGFNKNVVGGALISQDVTKEKEVEQKLIKARREAEDADKAKSLFLANMSHEIRTPLNAILGFTGLLNKTELTPKQDKFCRLISQSSEHLLSVVNEVLFLFKLGMGKLYMEKVPFNSYELVQNVRDSLLFRAEEKNLQLNYFMDKAIPRVLIGDPFRVKQILMNLTGNALKYTEKGGVFIRVSSEKATRKKVFLRFEVEDTGIGISKADLDTIFEEFTQLGQKNDKIRKGAGLGLTIVRKLVELLNGRIHVDSEVGEGTVFTVVIPFEKPQEKETVVPEKTYRPDYKLLEGKQLLYADDDENNLLLGESIFSEWNADYVLTRDGEETLRKIQEKTFDVVLLDIQMPGLSGVDVVKRIRKMRDNPNRQTIILAVTANIMKSDLDKYMASGFDDYILKPFRQENLYNKICHLLNLEPEEGIKENERETNPPEGSGKKLDTTLLLKNAGGNFSFFNRMIDTFITNVEEMRESMIRMSKEEDWEGIGKKAHKAIPSFRYFGLNSLADNLVRLEKMGLHDRDFAPMKSLTEQTVAAAKAIIREAENAKIPDEEC